MQIADAAPTAPPLATAAAIAAKLGASRHGRLTLCCFMGGFLCPCVLIGDCRAVMGPQGYVAESLSAGVSGLQLARTNATNGAIHSG
ncbi:MAG: hypothetical protein VB878_06395 [Pirellulaceae bacterium]